MKFRFRLKVKITKNAVGYAAFAVAMLLLFLYLRFPGDTFARYLASSVAAMNPNAVLLIDDVKPTLVPGIRLKNVALGFRDNPPATLQADAVTVTPDYMTLAKGRTSVLLSATGYGGTVKGSLGTGHFLSLQGPISVKLTFDGLAMEKIGYLKERLGRQVTGKLKGTLSYSGNPQALMAGAGTFDLTISNGSYPLLENILGVDKLDFRKVDALFSMKNGILTISRLKLAGEKVNAALSGDIILNNDDLRSSQINLTCTLEAAGQNKKLSMSLTGILSNPIMKYM